MKLSEIFTTDRAHQALSSSIVEKFAQKKKETFLMMYQLFGFLKSHCTSHDPAYSIEHFRFAWNISHFVERIFFGLQKFVLDVSAQFWLRYETRMKCTWITFHEFEKGVVSIRPFLISRFLKKNHIFGISIKILSKMAFLFLSKNDFHFSPRFWRH